MRKTILGALVALALVLPSGGCATMFLVRDANAKMSTASSGELDKAGGTVSGLGEYVLVPFAVVFDIAFLPAEIVTFPIWGLALFPDHGTHC